MINYEKELNKEQLKVVREGDGACLVLSGPGSGKTRTLVYRTAYLLEKGVPADQILLLTFTKKAAKEMLARVFSLLGKETEGVCGGTFHHAGNLFLRHYASRIGYSGGFTIIDEEDSREIISSILKEKKTNIRARPVQNIISLSINSKKEIKSVFEESFSHIDEDSLSAIEETAKEYAERKKRSNLMDFDDLLLNWMKILSLAEVRKEISSRFSYILVDEYQDTNALQDEIVKGLGEKRGNILAVGDDAQSIFSFRAADVQNILRFPETYPNAKIFRLESNYRSTSQILSLANEVINNNSERLEKELKSVNGDGSDPVVVPLDDPFKQAEFVAEQICDLKRAGERFSEMAILFRAHYHSAELEIELARRGVPYVMRGGVRFFEQAHIKDVSAFLRIIANHLDESSWRRLLFMREGIGKTYAEKVVKKILTKKSIENILSEKEEIVSAVPLRAQKGLLSLFSLIEEAFWKKNVSDAIDVFLSGFYNDYLRYSFENARERMNDLRRFHQLAGEYEDAETMMAEFSLSEDFRSEAEDKKEKVTLSTVHQAKGLEWNTVFIIFLKEGEFPYVKALEEGSLEEERRLFYVAVTRCKNNLYLTYPVYSFRGKGFSKPSRFIKEAKGNSFFEEDIIEDEGWEPF